MSTREFFEAAEKGQLPPSFQDWDLLNRSQWTVAHHAARYGTLPKHFSCWALKDKDGRSVAHWAAFYGNLPLDFDQWNLNAPGNWSVAHEAAKKGHLPQNFTQWDITDEQGLTVAHVAAKKNHLHCFPSDFDGFHWLTDNGQSVFAMIRGSHDSRSSSYRHWLRYSRCGEYVFYDALFTCYTKGVLISKDFDGFHWLDKDKQPIVFMPMFKYHKPKYLKYKHWRY